MSLSCLIIIQPLIRAPCSDSLWDIFGEFDPHWVPVYCSLFVRLTIVHNQQMNSLIINENIQKSNRTILSNFEILFFIPHTLQTSDFSFVVFGTTCYVFQRSSSVYVVGWKPSWQASFSSLTWWFPCKHQSRYLVGGFLVSCWCDGVGKCYRNFEIMLDTILSVGGWRIDCLKHFCNNNSDKNFPKNWDYL